jgi:hypothetical protein
MPSLFYAITGLINGFAGLVLGFLVYLKGRGQGINKSLFYFV